MTHSTPFRLSAIPLPSKPSQMTTGTVGSRRSLKSIKGLASAASLLVIVSLVGCAGGPEPQLARCDPGATAAVDVSEIGPFNVGYAAFEHTYEAPGGVGSRTITVNVWYPTEDTDGEHPRYLGIQEDTAAFLDAPPASALSDCGYPVLAHSHGNWGLAGGGAFLMRHFASHGWAVVAPDHTGNTLAEIGNDDERPTALRFLRTLDVSESLNAMESLASHPLANKLALDHVVVSGHSFGAFTAFSVGGSPFDVDAIRKQCSELPSCTDEELEIFGRDLTDPRVVAIIPMAGTPSVSWFGENGAGNVRVPVLNMTGTADSVEFGAFWEQLGSHSSIWIEFEGACHESFNLGIPPCTSFDTNEGYELVSAWALAFARHQLLQDETVLEVLDGTRSLSERLTVHRKLK